MTTASDWFPLPKIPNQKPMPNPTPEKVENTMMDIAGCNSGPNFHEEGYQPRKGFLRIFGLRAKQG